MLGNNFYLIQSAHNLISDNYIRDLTMRRKSGTERNVDMKRREKFFHLKSFSFAFRMFVVNDVEELLFNVLCCFVDETVMSSTLLIFYCCLSLRWRKFLLCHKIYQLMRSLKKDKFYQNNFSHGNVLLN